MERYAERYQIGKTLKLVENDPNGNKYFVMNSKSGKIIFYFEKHHMSIVKIVIATCILHNQKFKKFNDDEIVGWKLTGKSPHSHALVKLRDGTSEITPFALCDSDESASTLQDFFNEYGIYLKEAKN